MLPLRDVAQQDDTGGEHRKPVRDRPPLLLLGKPTKVALAGTRVRHTEEEDMKRMKVMFGQRRIMILATLAILVLAAAALAASSASFTATSANAGNVFTAGTPVHLQQQARRLTHRHGIMLGRPVAISVRQRHNRQHRWRGWAPDHDLERPRQRRRRAPTAALLPSLQRARSPDCPTTWWSLTAVATVELSGAGVSLALAAGANDTYARIEVMFPDGDTATERLARQRRTG